MASDSSSTNSSINQFSMIDYKQEHVEGPTQHLQQQQNDYYIQHQQQHQQSGVQQSIPSPSDISGLSKACLNRTNSSNLIQDESLIREIQKFPCLYDRTHPGYKKEEACHQAWMHIREECGWIESNEEAARLFEVLKKRYSKKKMDYKRARLTSEGTLLAKKTESELEKYNFMKWMEPFIRFRTTKIMNEKPSTVENNKSPSQIYHRSSRDNEQPTVSKAMADYAYQQTVGGRKRSYDFARTPPPHRVYYEEQSSRVSYTKPSMAVSDLNGRRNYTPNNTLNLDRLAPDTTVKRSRVVSQSHDDSYNSDTTPTQQDIQQLQQQQQQQRSYNDKDTQQLQHPQHIQHQQQQQQQQQQVVYSDHHSSSPTPTEMSHKSGDEQQNNTLKYTTTTTKLMTNEDETFSAFIISEMKNLDEKRRYKVKHMISNVLFDALVEQCEEKKNNEQNTTMDSPGVNNVVPLDNN